MTEILHGVAAALKGEQDYFSQLYIYNIRHLKKAKENIQPSNILNDFIIWKQDNTFVY